jgi:hypothetical protein
MAQGLSDSGKKWVTIKAERRDRRLSYYRELRPCNSVKLLTVTMITDSQVLWLLSYVAGRPKTPSSPLFACTTPRLPQAEAQVSKKPNSSPQGGDSTRSNVGRFSGPEVLSNVFPHRRPGLINSTRKRRNSGRVRRIQSGSKPLSSVLYSNRPVRMLEYRGNLAAHTSTRINGGPSLTAGHKHPVNQILLGA